MYFKTVKDGYIVAITTNIGNIPISESEYRSILDLVKHTPETPEGFEYMLRDGTFEWVLVEISPEPPEPEPEPTVEAKAEAYDILMGVSE